MTEIPHFRRRTMLLIGVGLLLGFGVGFAYRFQPGQATGHPTPTTGEASSSPQDRSARVNASTRSKTSRRDPAEAGALTFSREQWKHLLRKGHAFNISLTDCIQWSRNEHVPVEFERDWGFGGFVPKVVEGGPDLEPVARFLGLDEARKAKLGESLRGFGEDLRRLEREHAEIAYGGDGTARISFGEGASLRQSLIPRLKEEVIAALGERDGERFATVSGLFGPDTLSSEMEVRFTVEKEFIRSELVGHSEVIMFHPIPEDVVPGAEDHQRRLQHLGWEVDWARLFAEAKTKAAP